MPKYTTVGSVRECCGHAHRSHSAAAACAARDHRGAAQQGGHSDRKVVEILPGESVIDAWDRIARQ